MIATATIAQQPRLYTFHPLLVASQVHIPLHFLILPRRPLTTPSRAAKNKQAAAFGPLLPPPRQSSSPRLSVMSLPHFRLLFQISPLHLRHCLLPPVFLHLLLSPQASKICRNKSTKYRGYCGLKQLRIVFILRNELIDICILYATSKLVTASALG